LWNIWISGTEPPEIWCGVSSIVSRNLYYKKASKVNWIQANHNWWPLL
jgi:hypothetical protein